MTTGDRVIRKTAPITALLRRWAAGDSAALGVLLPSIYDEARKRARQLLRSEPPELELAPTGLLHEAFLRLLAGRRVHCHDRQHFRALLTRVMRHVLIDQAKQRQRKKSPPGRSRSAVADALSLVDGLSPEERSAGVPEGEALALEGQVKVQSAMAELARIDPTLLRIVELRHIEGLSVEATGVSLSLSPATIKRRSRFARAFLIRQLSL